MIHVIGDIILDEYWYGSSERISPEAPVPVVLRKKALSRLGGAANVALNIKTLEEPVSLLGVLGQDDTAAKVLGLLKESEIQSQVLQMPDVMSIQKLRILANDHYIGRVDFEEPFEPKGKDLLKSLESQKDLSWCVLSDYGKGTLTGKDAKDNIYGVSNDLIQTVVQKNGRVLVDPKAPFGLYKQAWLIKPNKKEFERYVGKFSDLDHLCDLARKSLKENQIENMLVTLGAEGMVLVNSQSFKHWPSQALDVFDVTGAGDTVIAVLASFMAKGEDLSFAIEMANRAAAIAVRKKGVYNVKLQELMDG